MKTCKNCGCELRPGFVLTRKMDMRIHLENMPFSGADVKCAACPQCGELSFYVEDMDSLREMIAFDDAHPIKE